MQSSNYFFSNIMYFYIILKKFLSPPTKAVIFCHSYLYFLMLPVSNSGPASVVGIASGYGLGDLGIESR
jgi:hypothetical protein